MLAYYLNRSDRPDRNFLYKGAMAAAGFAPNELFREIAVNKEDYPSHEALCEAAATEFPEFFRYHLDQKHWYPGYGHMVCSWGTMRAWRRIANGDALAVFTCDDYYLKDKWRLEELVKRLGSPNIVQLAHHARDDLFLHDQHDLELPYKFGAYQLSSLTPDVFDGMAYSSSESHLLSPYGASCLLEYMAEHPKLNTEPVSQGMCQAWMHGKFKFVPGTYSVVDNDVNESGLVVMRNNGWLGHLVEYTQGAVSDLQEVHDATY